MTNYFERAKQFLVEDQEVSLATAVAYGALFLGMCFMAGYMIQSATDLL